MLKLSERELSEKSTLIDEKYPEVHILHRSRKVQLFLCGLERNMEEGFTAKEYGDFLGLRNIYGRSPGNPLYDAAKIQGVNYDSLLQIIRRSFASVSRDKKEGRSSMDENKTIDATAETLLAERNPELLDANEKKRKGERTMNKKTQNQNREATTTKKAASKTALPSTTEIVEGIVKERQTQIEEIESIKKEIKNKMDEIDDAGKEIDDVKAKLGGHKKQLAEFQKKLNRMETNLKKTDDKLDEVLKKLTKTIEVEISIENATFVTKDGSQVSTAGDEKIFKSLRSRQEIDDKFNGREIRIASKMKAIRQNSSENEIKFNFIDGDRVTQNRIVELYQK